ncbi:hypothetical protein OUZ56_023981 [Daphnia magna]|uniref:Uncharacterized protein n=1 Tax=Daphnia magna TaxID=35525 RepID=A0ABR0AZW7_9CRUS|nr:hypothetical protein OUZ56_023981 [Daphnia magna]
MAGFTGLLAQLVRAPFNAEVMSSILLRASGGKKFTFWKYFGDEKLMKEITVAIAVRKRSKFLQQPGHEIEKLFASSILGLGNTMVH